MLSLSEQIEIARILADDIANWVYGADICRFNAELMEFREAFYERALKLIESDPECELSKALLYNGPVYRIQEQPVGKELNQVLLSWSSDDEILYEYGEDIDPAILITSQSTPDNIGVSVVGLENFLNRYHDSLTKHISITTDLAGNYINPNDLDPKNENEIICRLQKPYIVFHSLDAYIRSPNRKGENNI